MSRASSATFAGSRWLFLRLLGVVYLIGFVSLAAQITGLVGERGLLPVGEFLSQVRATYGAEAYRLWPTLVWLSPGDVFLSILCWAGAFTSLLLVAGIAPAAAAAVLWVLYLSLTVAGQVFLQFQWDALLLETGLLAILYAPFSWRSRLGSDPEPPAIVRWVLWGLAFKLTFLSGITKILSGDATWANWTALSYHYETQPIPAWPSWFMHHLPPTIHYWSAAGMLAVEVGVPWLIFAPPRFRRARLTACALMVLLQVAIAATGNYGFFNLLTITLYVALLDDRTLHRFLPALSSRWWKSRCIRRAMHPFATPARKRARLGPRARRRCSSVTYSRYFPSSRLAGQAPRSSRCDAGLPPPAASARGEPTGGRAGGPMAWRTGMDVVALGIGCLSVLALVREIDATRGRRSPIGGVWSDEILGLVSPLDSINGYGLFRVMTTERPEIVIEVSEDGSVWREYEFRWKAGNVMRRPQFVQPHMPRLDWQMWFAALDPRSAQVWLGPLLERVLEGEVAVTRLMGPSPLAGRARYARLAYYQYHFTTSAERASTGAWWKREFVGYLTDSIGPGGVNRSP